MTAYMEANQPCSALQMSRDLGMTRQSIYERRRLKEMRIAAYVREPNGHNSALYVLGWGTEAKKPESLTPAERSKRYLARNPAVMKLRRPSKLRQAVGLWGGLI